MKFISLGILFFAAAWLTGCGSSLSTKALRSTQSTPTGLNPGPTVPVSESAPPGRSSPVPIPVPITNPVPTDPIDGFVTYAYAKLLGRSPDPEGYRTWVGGLRSGVLSPEEVLFNILLSPEYEGLHRDPTNFVESLYRNLLLRKSDPPGLANWVDLLSRGGSREEVVYGFLESDEFRCLQSGYAQCR